jgi:hypothetical protein
MAVKHNQAQWPRSCSGIRDRIVLVVIHRLSNLMWPYDMNCMIEESEFDS